MGKEQALNTHETADKWTPEGIAAEILHELVNNAKIPFEFIESRITEALSKAKELEDEGEAIWLTKMMEALPQEAHGIIDIFAERMESLLKEFEMSSLVSMTNESYMCFLLDYPAKNGYESTENHRKFHKEKSYDLSYKRVKQEDFGKKPFKANKETGRIEYLAFNNPCKKERLNMEIVPIMVLEPINTE